MWSQDDTTAIRRTYYATGFPDAIVTLNREPGPTAGTVKPVTVIARIRSLWLYLGLTHGVITTLGSTDRDLPVNKRFYPGGENSLRGYADGEAAPRGPHDTFLGAKSYTLLNVELEQAVTKNISVVLFADTLSTAVQLSRYPVDESLLTAGLGVRYQTLIGPVRLEYGRNLNPRPNDPSGTFHLSLGFPF